MDSKYLVWLDFIRNFVWSIFILIFTFVKTITGDLFTTPELPEAWQQEPNCLAFFETVWLILVIYVQKRQKAASNVKMKRNKFLISTVLEKQDIPSDCCSKLGSEHWRLDRITWDMCAEDCSKSFKTKNHVNVYYRGCVMAVYAHPHHSAL